MRLIDADKLKSYLSEYLHYNHAIPWVDAQPTAYDIDKVVDELKILKKESLVEYNMGEYNIDNNIGNKIAETYRQDMNEGKCFAFDEAIEIVTQGCVASDDVCEWESDYKIISDKYKRVTGCGHEFYDLHHAAPFKYCPYCGKKIKVGGKNDN